ncbi:hypothetical protein CAOG_01217 [Capsaspora owczarzaki ATCC 30864]|uniref:DOMON domain-containing protein n=1 Tax=Capsaspora owczarzaki (strain ATCC 30864) TaxID=595528 RepID=A0A0D2WJY1_CAPO3|nr:hypothetical protein CAOG_01217 [Capsaspora owczarzaki ATCC 30864]KJE89793.1 hypothetical protein CAOG_001217 [Capsaspora owczarzaki ATCC 30864]|eukprot:XP_004349714.2 hypothetical protein CAOG_01217 [Capsaspora owczarzaki ATCC 30864]
MHLRLQLALALALLVLAPSAARAQDPDHPDWCVPASMAIQFSGAWDDQDMFDRSVMQLGGVRGIAYATSSSDQVQLRVSWTGQLGFIFDEYLIWNARTGIAQLAAVAMSTTPLSSPICSTTSVKLDAPPTFCSNTTGQTLMYQEDVRYGLAWSAERYFANSNSTGNIRIDIVRDANDATTAYPLMHMFYSDDQLTTVMMAFNNYRPFVDPDVFTFPPSCASVSSMPERPKNLPAAPFMPRL